MELKDDVLDLNFIRSLDKDLANDLLNVCILGVEEICKAANSPENVDDIFFKSLDKDQINAMYDFYTTMLDIFLENELYEHCGKLSDFIGKLKEFKN
jgi:hypothetical protein